MQIKRVHGPYVDAGGRIRLVIVYSDGSKDSRRGFASRPEAEAVKKALLRQIELQRSLKIMDALEEYREYLTREGNKAGSIATTLTRLKTFFGDLDRAVATLTATYCSARYDDLTSRKSLRTGKPVQPDTHRNTLAEARTFLGWCVKKGHLKDNPLQKVRGVGRRQHGKVQLRIDEGKRLVNKCLEQAALGQDGAVAVLVALLMGFRASEIVTRQVRDLDDNARVLWIDRGKSPAAQRRPDVPDVLRPHLQRLAHGRKPTDKLFGDHYRDWVRETAAKLCDQAGVARVTAHGLRGMCSTLAIASGQASHAVAAMLGHASPSVTEQSYMAPGTKEARGQRELLARLNESAAPPAARRCRVCGCTDDDCSQCIAKTGKPCRWVAPDLCSACA